MWRVVIMRSRRAQARAIEEAVFHYPVGIVAIGAFGVPVVVVTTSQQQPGFSQVCTADIMLFSTCHLVKIVYWHMPQAVEIYFNIRHFTCSVVDNRCSGMALETSLLDRGIA